MSLSQVSCCRTIGVRDIKKYYMLLILENQQHVMYFALHTCTHQLYVA